MKTIINEIPLFKATVKPDGQIDVSLSGGKQFTGKMTDAETEQFLFCVSRISEKAIAFDPEPQDLVNVHNQDVETLEKQAIALNEVREANNILSDSFNKQVLELEDSKKRVADAEKEVDELRRNLRDVRIALSEANEKLSVQVETKVDESVHNVRSETEQTSPQEASADTEQMSSVHNVHSAETVAP